MLSVSVSISAQRILKQHHAFQKQFLHTSLFKLCKDICSTRSHSHLATTLERQLPSIFAFECACILSFKDGELYRTNRLTLESEEVVRHLARVPLELGLTGKCVAEKRAVVSLYGSREPGFSSHADNVVNVKQLENMVVVPLISGCFAKAFHKEERNLVGVLQLINYKGNIKLLDIVF